jgi:polyhydroxybutyrate depolymerase
VGHLSCDDSTLTGGADVTVPVDVMSPGVAAPRGTGRLPGGTDDGPSRAEYTPRMRVRSTTGIVLLAGALCHCGSTVTSGDTGHPDGSSSGVKPDASTSHQDATADTGHPSPRRDASGPEDADAGRDASDAAVDAPPVPCGSRTGMRGLTSRSVVVGGKARTYLIYLPSSFDPTTPIPFVFVFHGFTMSGLGMYDITRYAALADAEGIGVAFPDGEGGPDSLAAPWNITNPGQTVCGNGELATTTGDDFGFIDAMKVDVAEDQCLDTAHIFSTGFSMGGYFSHHIGCYRSDMRAVAPHSGGMIADLSVCTTGHVPIIIFHGTADPTIDDACDDPTVPMDPGFPASATLWAAKNGCATTYTTMATDGDAGAEAGTGQCYLYDGCPSDGQVELCTFNGMVHCWAGGSQGGDAGEGASACPTYASATQLEWSFFKKYAW